MSVRSGATLYEGGFFEDTRSQLNIGLLGSRASSTRFDKSAKFKPIVLKGVVVGRFTGVRMPMNVLMKYCGGDFLGLGGTCHLMRRLPLSVNRTSGTCIRLEHTV